MFKTSLRGFDWHQVVIQNDTTVFLRDFLRKKSIFLKQTHKTIRLTQKKWNNRQYDRESFQSPTFLEKMGKTSSLYLLSFKKFNSFVSCLSQNLLSMRTMTLRNTEKKTTEAKKEKGEPLNCFLWQVAFMQHFLTYVPHQFQFVFCFFPPWKNKNLRLNSTLEGLFLTLFIATKQF